MIETILRKLTTEEIRTILIYYGQPADLNRFEEAQQILFITNLLKTNTREQIAKRLIKKFNISRSTAYRRINTTLCQNTMSNETELCFNFSIPGAIKSRVKKDG